MEQLTIESRFSHAGPGLPPPRSVDWSSEINRSFFPLMLEALRPGEFAAQTVAKVRPGCRLAQIKASAHVARMTPAACARLPQKQVKVLWLRQGTAQFNQDHRTVDLSAGMWMLYEASQPYEMQMSDGVDFAVMFHAVDERDAWLRTSRSRALVPQNTIEAAKLALEMVTAALADDVHMASGTCSAFNLGVRAMLDVALHAQGAVPNKRAAESLLSLLHQAKAYLLSHLTDADLGPDRVAQALGVSRRTLYKAFEQVCQTPQAFLLRARLERCREVLQTHGEPVHSLTHLAQEYGFGDAAHFSRSYKQAFGESPSAARLRRPVSN